MAQPLSPRDWRQSQKLSLEAAAVRLGVSGKNPARTWQRWETGQHAAPLEVIIAVEQMSGGRVTPASWAQIRRRHSEVRA